MQFLIHLAAFRVQDNGKKYSISQKGNLTSLNYISTLTTSNLSISHRHLFLLKNISMSQQHCYHFEITDPDEIQFEMSLSN